MDRIGYVCSQVFATLSTVKYAMANFEFEAAARLNFVNTQVKFNRASSIPELSHCRKSNATLFVGLVALCSTQPCRLACGINNVIASR